MSRSIKRPWVKISDTEMKRIGNRCIRHKTKMLLNRHPARSLDYDDLIFPLRKEVSNQYDVCDWRRFVNDPEYRRK